jgi:hypothetical protein
MALSFVASVTMLFAGSGVAQNGRSNFARGQAI